LPLTLTLPDVESALVTYGKAYAALTAVTGTRIATELPPKPSFPSLKLTRVGGTPEHTGVDHPIIQFECYGTTDLTAYGVYEKAFKAFIELPYVAPVQGSVYFGAADPAIPLNFLPDTSIKDPTSGKSQPRYIFGIMFRAQQYP